MEILIFKIVVIILLIRVIALSIGHLLIVFWNEGTKMAVEELLKNPIKYIKDEHIGIFYTNMIWVMIFVILLIGVFKGNITFN